jgi:cell division protein FtsQ
MRMYWIVLALLAALAAWAAWTLATLPAFHLQSLTVDGVEYVERSQVVARAAIDPNLNVWLLDTRAAERRIEAIPYVLRARIHRTLPGHVRIEVVERAPEACVRFAGGASVTVDAPRRVLALGCADAPLRFYDLRARRPASPGEFLQDSELLRLQADERTLTGLGANYRNFEHDGFDGLRTTLPGGVTVLFGDEDDLAAKQRLVDPILERLGSRAEDVATLDLRAPNAPVVVYRPTVVHRFSTQYIQGTHRPDHNM